MTTHSRVAASVIYEQASSSAAKKRARQKRYYQRHRLRVLDKTKWLVFKAWSGIDITPEWFAAQLLAQGGKCAICGLPETSRHKSGNVKRLSVDHDGRRLRALLCARCNRGIGLLFDSPALLRAAAEYIEQHRNVLAFEEGKSA